MLVKLGGVPGEPQIQISEVDASCRAALRLTVVCGALWLLIGAALELFCSIKLVSPQFMTASPCWTYGRIHAACGAALRYGFALPMAFGLCAWLLSRLGGVRLAGAGMVVIAAVFWNFGVTIGVGEILAGDATGFDGFEIPRYATPILFSSYLVVATCAALTVWRRGPGALSVSEWFALGALGWFGWVELTANVFLLFEPARGIVAPVIAAWHARSVDVVVLGFAGLAVVFYLVPKLIDQPLFSRPLALFGLWSLALFGGFGGLDTPLPAWVGAVNRVAGVMSLATLLALGVNFGLTVRRRMEALDADPALRFTYVGMVMWIIASAQAIAGAVPTVVPLVDFTFFTPAQKDLFFWGFFVMVSFGALDYVLPRVLGRSLPSTRLRSAHFWCVLAGVGLAYLSVLVAGVGQGILLNDPANSFTVVMKTILPPLQVAVLGKGLVTAGVACFAVNVFWMVFGKGTCVVTNVIPEKPVEPFGASPAFGPLAGIGLFASLLVSWAALVLGPVLQLGGLQQAPMIGVDTRLYPKARSGMAARGAEIFRANGCVQCHTQQVRPSSSGSDLARGWGKRRSVARDYIFDHPALPGSVRIGPDLANIGSRQNLDTLLLRLYDPPALTRGSIMPPFRYLFEPATVVSGQKTELVPRPEARALAAYLQSLHSDGSLYETPPRVGREVQP